MSEITLEFHEIMLAAIAGVMRHVENMKLDRKPAHGAGKDNDWQLNIEGCIGEYVLSKYLDVPWKGKGTFRDHDVGDVDVRTARGHNRRLILHDSDDSDRRYWLVTGEGREFIVHGWIWGDQGKNGDYLDDPTGNNRWAYFVPQHVLKQAHET